MSTKIYQALAIVLLLLWGSPAQAAISCNLSSSGFSSAYVPTNAGFNITPTSFTVTCTRGVATDATSETVTVKVSNGINSTGTQNRGVSGGNFILYDNYINATCATVWRNTSLSATVNMVGFAPSSSQSVAFWGCIPSGQTTVPAGTYTDTVTLTPTFSNKTTVSSATTFPVSIVTPALCSIAVAPGNVTFSYTAFQTLAAQANTTFSANCTNQLPYSMALDGIPSSGIYPGVVSGMNYGLSIGTTAGGAAILPTDTRTGNGLQQQYYINATMVSGQAGTCASASCLASDPRTLTITY